MSAIDFIELLTAVWLFGLAAIAVARILHGRGHASLVLTCVHFIFFGMPLWLDRLGAAVEITTYPGFLRALEHADVRLAYCGVVAVAPLIWQFVGRPAQWTRRVPVAARPISALEYLLAVLPIALAPVLFDASALRNYGGVAQDAVSVPGVGGDGTSPYDVMALATLLAVSTVGGILARHAPLNGFQGGLLVLATFAALWLNGKRAIVAIAVLWFAYALWRRAYVPSLRAIQVGAVTIAILTGTLIGYQWYVRGIGVTDPRSYAVMRVDYGRDLVLRQALLPEVAEGEPPLLEYRGQSFLFYPTLVVPRTLWPEKPWPFAVYQTSRMLGIPTRAIGWGITTSWLDESVANLGWTGALLGPLFLGLLCRVGHRARDPENDAVTVVVTALFLAVQAGAFVPLIVVWLVRVARTRGVELDAGRSHRDAPAREPAPLLVAPLHASPLLTARRD